MASDYLLHVNHQGPTHCCHFPESHDGKGSWPKRILTVSASAVFLLVQTIIFSVDAATDHDNKCEEFPSARGFAIMNLATCTIGIGACTYSLFKHKCGSAPSNVPHFDKWTIAVLSLSALASIGEMLLHMEVCDDHTASSSS